MNRMTIRNLAFRAVALRDRLFGRHKGLPPRHLVYSPLENYLAVGYNFRRHLEELAGLSPNSAIIDVGCGAGRMAYALRDAIPSGRYVGFDISRGAIDWCRRKIPQFEWHHSDIRNEHYNSTGAIEAESFAFPAGNGEFNIALAASLYTHLQRPVAEHYLQETARVLRPGGRSIATFFILDEVAESGIEQNISSYSFKNVGGGGFYEKKGNIEAAIAFRPDTITDMHVKAGLRIIGIYPGSWSGRDGRDHQDIVVSEPKIGSEN